MKTSITLRLEARLLDNARLLADQQGVSVNRYLAELLEERFRRDESYEEARKRTLARLSMSKVLGWSPSTSPDELHER